MLSKQIRTLTLAVLATSSAWGAQAQQAVARPAAPVASQAMPSAPISAATTASANPHGAATPASAQTSPYAPGSIGAWAYNTTHAAEKASGPIDLIVGVFGPGLLLYLGGGVALVLLVLALTVGRRSSSLG